MTRRETWAKKRIQKVKDRLREMPTEPAFVPLDLDTDEAAPDSAIQPVPSLGDARIGWDDKDPDTYVAPRNRKELAFQLKAMFGMSFPEKAVCPDHTAVFEALAEAYFAETPVSIWIASRGFGGKTVALAALSLMELIGGYNVAILGGSGEQTSRTHKVSRDAWDHQSMAVMCLECHELNLYGETKCNDCGKPLDDDDPRIELGSPADRLKGADPLVTRTIMNQGNEMQALTASQKSARGPHPQRLRMDEADEMDIRIIDAAMGQTMMTDPDLPPQTVFASTHHHERGVMTELLIRAAERGWPVRRWCYKETLFSEDNPGSWLLPANIEAKKGEVTSHMWRIEYDLERPSEGGAMFSKEKLVSLFYDVGSEGIVDDALNQFVILEEYDPRGDYVTSADWGRKTDLSVIATIRYDVIPPRLVAWARLFHQPWPLAIAHYNKRATEMYPGKGIHDATGLGDVVAGYLDVPEAVDYIFTPASKTKCYMDYEAGVDSGAIRLPKLKSLIAIHRHVQREDLYGGGHPPDEIVALALGWQIAGVTLIRKKGKSGIGRVRTI